MKNFLKLIAIAMPAGDSSVNTSLKGEWKSQDGVVIRFFGDSTGDGDLVDPAKYIPYLAVCGKLKDKKVFIGLKKAGELRWGGAEATLSDSIVKYKTCEITMGNDGKHIQVEGTNGKKNYTRKE